MNNSFHTTSRQNTAVDAGLRAFMQRVFGLMGLGLGLTALVAYFVASTPSIYMPLLTTNLKWVLFFATIGIPLTLGMGINRLSTGTASALFWVYAALMGASLSSILLLYTGESVARVFLITSCLFGGMSLYGYTTQKDLTSWGSFLFMGLMGLVLATIVNAFVGSSAFQMALSVIAVLVFTGLTAYDVQIIRRFYHTGMGADAASRASILGALRLYLDFINIFVALMRLMGDRR